MRQNLDLTFDRLAKAKEPRNGIQSNSTTIIKGTITAVAISADGLNYEYTVDLHGGELTPVYSVGVSYKLSVGAIVILTQTYDGGIFILGETFTPGQPVGWLVVGATGQPPFGTSWYASTFTATWGAPAFRKDGNRVQLMGLARRINTTGDSIFVLPVGFRPLKDAVFPALTDLGLQRIDVQAAGTVLAYGFPASAVDWVSLAPITFIAE